VRVARSSLETDVDRPRGWMYSLNAVAAEPAGDVAGAQGLRVDAAEVLDPVVGGSVDDAA
jgi:hypothetical protein